MGTLAEIGVVHSDEYYSQQAMDAAFAELRLIDRLMTRFDERSEVGLANGTAATDGVPVSERTAHVLGEALAWAEVTHGRFDPCLGNVVRLWDVGNRSAPPAERDVHRLAGRGLYRGLDLSRSGGRPTVRFTDRDAALDLGGIAKGYGVDRAVQVLREWGIEHGLVNVGGDLYAMGLAEDGEPWTAGVRSPHDPDQLTDRIELSDAAVATSGDYLQYFQHGGEKYHHLIDPTTGAPWQSAVHSVTVRADRCITADAAATAAFGLGRGEAQGLISRRSSDATIVSAA
jgi:thiamine biosynthesis lipoprotein